MSDDAEWVAGLLRPDRFRAYLLGRAESDRWSSQDAPRWVADLIRAVEQAMPPVDGGGQGGEPGSR